MLFAWMGFLKPGADPIPQSVQQQTTDFLGQPYIDIQSVGPLRDADRQARGDDDDLRGRGPREGAKHSSRAAPISWRPLREHRLHEYQSEV